MAKIAIVGSRKYPCRADVEFFLDMLSSNDTVISGHSPGGGVDIWAEDGARRRGLGTAIYPISPIRIKQVGFREAALERNWEIVKACDGLIAFWNGNSTGTIHSFCAAYSLGKPRCLITPGKEENIDDMIDFLDEWK